MDIAAQIEELESQLRRLKDRQLLELRVKLAEAKALVVSLEEQLRDSRDFAKLQPGAAECRKAVPIPASQVLALPRETIASPSYPDSTPTSSCHPPPSQNTSLVPSHLPDNGTLERRGGIGMLVLGRRVGQTIMIGDTIELLVGRIERYQVQLRISVWRDSDGVTSSSVEPLRRYGLLGRVGQPLIISDNIEVMVSRIDRAYAPQADQARIRICAPREIRIYRGEIYREIQINGFRTTGL
jgi:sRNA-binding carbon storage regulator CsrA